jgi:hypothetical protein
MNNQNEGRLPPRLRREARTVEAMIRLYCRGHHGPSDSLCPECAPLLDYARRRLQHCPFQAGKTTCARCAVHCYRPEMRQRIRVVMRYAGPRMIVRHPWLTLCHLWDGLRREPVDGAAAGRAKPS